MAERHPALTEPVIHEFTILREGWEMDNRGWVTKDRNTGKLLAWTTSHGGLVPLSINELRETMADHRRAVLGLEAVCDLLGVKP